MEEFNLTPSPALLDLLGKIPFKGWQCVAELIDNSIDAIINNTSKLKEDQKAISVYIPTRSRLAQQEALVVEDWGIGMTEDQLENAVKAGFSNKSTSINLGLFGMGFNVATSRLANTVEVWSATESMEKEVGVRIDLKEMKKTGSFVRPRMVREKRNGKKSGTRIEIFDYKPEAYTLLQSKQITRELNRAYSERIFSEYGIKISVNGEYITPFRFCVWDKKRSVKHGYNEIHALIEIDEHLQDDTFCESCFSWLGKSIDTKLMIECPNCNVIGKMVKKDIYIKGWVGIQRYSDTEHYGVDISRNGRILSKLDKTFFYWEDERGINDPEGRFSPEYPRDTTYAGGRIVGQIEANFIIPKYTKDDFEREDLNWRLAVNFLRGEMPLQPELASTLFGYKQPNRSPIGLLFSGFKSIKVPGAKTLIFAKENGGVDYVTPKNWAHKFYSGDPEYQDDSKWWEAVTSADLKEDATTFTPLNPLVKKLYGPNDIKITSPSQDKYPGKKILKKAIHIDIEKLIGEKPFDLTLFDYTPNSEILNPIIFEAQGSIGKFNVYLNSNHPMFRDFADGYEDLIYVEVAALYNAMLTNKTDWTLTRIYYELKSKYALESMLSVSNLVAKASGLMRTIHNKLVEGVGVSLERKPLLTDLEVKTVKAKYLEQEGKPLNNIDSIITTTRFLLYLDLKYLFKFIKEFPDVVFDNKILSLPFLEIEDLDIRMDELSKYLGYLNDVKWFMDNLANQGDESIKKLKQQIIRNRISIEILHGSITK